MESRGHVWGKGGNVCNEGTVKGRAGVVSVVPVYIGDGDLQGNCVQVCSVVFFFV